ncbi:MAG: hypothetical protein QM775_29755 [Pirellulales bacterium]
MAPFFVDLAQIAAAVPHGGLQQLLDALPSAAYTCDADGRITAYNRLAETLWGRSPQLRADDELYCGSWRLFTETGDVLAHEDCCMARALRDGLSHSECRAVSKRPTAQGVWSPQMRTRFTISKGNFWAA